jgi:hypothetical protein
MAIVKLSHDRQISATIDVDGDLELCYEPNPHSGNDDVYIYLNPEESKQLLEALTQELTPKPKD